MRTRISRKYSRDHGARWKLGASKKEEEGSTRSHQVSPPLDDPERIIFDWNSRDYPDLQMVPHLLRVHVETRSSIRHEPTVLHKCSQVSVSHLIHLRGFVEGAGMLMAGGAENAQNHPLIHGMIQASIRNTFEKCIEHYFPAIFSATSTTPADEALMNPPPFEFTQNAWLWSCKTLRYMFVHDT